MKKSRCQKAAERFAWRFKGENIGAQIIREHRRNGFAGGSKALLRYAKKKSSEMGSGNLLLDAVIVELEQWVKGEK